MNACVPTGLMLAAGSLFVGSPGLFLTGLSVLAFGSGFFMGTRW